MKEKRLQIRQAGKDDVAQIVELNCALFGEDAGQRDPFMNLNWPREEGACHFFNLLTIKKNGLSITGITTISRMG